MAEKGIFFVPTFAVYEFHRKSPQPHVRERARELEEHHIASLRLALAAGVKIAAGTDAGGHGHPANADRDRLSRPRRHDAAARRCAPATGWAADCIGRGDDLGTVEKGKLADLVVVNGDPLADVAILQQRDQYRARRSRTAQSPSTAARAGRAGNLKVRTRQDIVNVSVTQF